MNSKYYTPTLEEFHAGFRYESYSVSTYDGNTMSHNWEPRIFKDGHKIYAGNDVLIPETCRVKFLDQQDIEELGWNYSGRTTELWFKIPDVDIQPFNLTYRSFMLSYSLDDYRCQIAGYEWTDCRSMNNNEGEVLFLGKVKNYNQLKQIMEWITIL